eukprot:COSAG03_NODE_27432_length_253_cov_0.668831_1_plen_71_part_10
MLEAKVEGQSQGTPRWTIGLPKTVETIRSIQELIAKTEAELSNGALSIPVEEQLLTFKGKRLQSDHHLADP